MTDLHAIDKAIDTACQLFRKAVDADRPEAERAMKLYIQKRREIREELDRLARNR